MVEGREEEGDIHDRQRERPGGGEKGRTRKRAERPILMTKTTFS